MYSKFKDSDVRTALDERNRGRAQDVQEMGGWRIVRRGDTEGSIAHEYVCPEHGAFAALVSRSSVPDAMPCGTCGSDSAWRGALCGIGKSSGEVSC